MRYIVVVFDRPRNVLGFSVLALMVPILGVHNFILTVK